MPGTTPIHAILAVTFAAVVAQALRLRRRGPKPLPQQNNCVYLDYAATCPIYPEVGDAMLPYLYSHWGNPSSSHAYGAPCRDAVTKARNSVATLIHADTKEITSAAAAARPTTGPSPRVCATTGRTSSCRASSTRRSSRASTRWRSRDGVK